MSFPPLTPQFVIEQGGWHSRYVEVIGIATDGPFGVALVDGNGDRADIEIEHWLYGGDGWVSPSSSGGGGPWHERSPWGGCSGIYNGTLNDSAFVAYGYAEGYQFVQIVFDNAERRVQVLPTAFWAFVTADHPHGADAIFLFD